MNIKFVVAGTISSVIGLSLAWVFIYYGFGISSWQYWLICNPIAFSIGFIIGRFAARK